MINYHDYLTPLEIDVNTQTWLDQGESQGTIDRWLRNEAHRVKGERMQQSGTDMMKGGSAFTGVLMLLMLCMVLFFGLIFLIA